MPTITYSQQEYEALQARATQMRDRIKALESMVPQWASDTSAYVKAVALQGIWDHLGVTNQTHCMVRLQKLTDFFKDCGHDINEGT